MTPPPAEDALRTSLRCLPFAALIGVLSGAASAAFLWLLEHATRYRAEHEYLVYALPIAGLVLGFIYERTGPESRGGTSVVLEAVADERAAVPLRMGPLVLLGTVLTHLFGGSAGREGTAVQMGGAIAQGIVTRFGKADLRRALLTCGMAGGFGSVFGTPIAGAIFAIEVGCVGRPALGLLLPALVSSLVGDVVTRKLGIVHSAYPVVQPPAWNALLLPKLALLGLACALAAILFEELTARLKRLLERVLSRLPLRMFVSGAALVLLWKVSGTTDYLGLGLPGIAGAFALTHIVYSAFLWKTLFTSVTLAGGFLGGEVTPLFFVGATLGHIAAERLGLPVDVGAALGMGAVFGAAANTPIALAIMIGELMGPRILPHTLFVCILACALTGHRGIYGAQRFARTKPWGKRIDPPMPLRALHASTPK